MQNGSKKNGLKTATSVLLLCVVAAAAFMAGRLTAPHDAQSGDTTAVSGSSKTITRDRFTVSYPAGWTLNEHDAEHFFTINGPNSAVVTVGFPVEPGDPAKAIEDVLESQRDRMPTLIKEASFSQWGRYEGVGQTLHGRFIGVPIQLRVFVYYSDSGAFLVQEFVAKEDVKATRADFQLIESTFQLHE